VSETLRPARPDEARDLAWAVLTASRGDSTVGTWDLLVEGDDADRLDVIESVLLADTPSSCHHASFHVLEANRGPAALLAAYDPGADGFVPLGATIAEAFDQLGYTDAELTAAFQRLADYDTCAPDSRPGTWILEWVATRPEHRGRGLAGRLLEHALDIGRSRGLESAQVSLAVGNELARRTYERLGFDVEHERLHPNFQRALGVPGMWQMGRDL
jgi:ribosomal protein S18 acetylase RimI-like enzyme